MNMKIVACYTTSEINGVITEQKSLFRPKGMCKFYATLEFRYKDLTSFTEMFTDHKCERKKFSKWAQPILDERSDEFYRQVVLKRLQENTERTEDVFGRFTVYVVL